ncbi:hypothetical protein J6E39_02145 [bacterium]|nr:hypothetical protein [bacterium]
MTTINPLGPQDDGQYDIGNKKVPATEIKSSIFNGLWNLSDYDGDGEFTINDIKSNNELFKHRVGLFLDKLISKGNKFEDVKGEVADYLRILEQDFGRKPAQSTVDIASKKNNEYFEETVNKFFTHEFTESADIEKMIKNHYKCTKKEDGSRVYVDKNSKKIMYKFNPNGDRIKFNYQEGSDNPSGFISVNPYELRTKHEYKLNEYGVYSEHFGLPGYVLTDDFDLKERDYYNEK